MTSSLPPNTPSESGRGGVMNDGSAKQHRNSQKSLKMQKRIETRQVAGQDEHVSCSFLTVKRVFHY